MDRTGGGSHLAPTGGLVSRGRGPMGSCAGAVRAARGEADPRRSPVLDSVSAAIPPGRPRSSAPRAAASRPCCGCSTGSPTPTAARSPIAAGRSPATTRSPCGARSRWCRSCRRCWRGRSSRTCATPPSWPASSWTRARCLRLAGLDPEFAGRDVAKLSVGEQQRAMLARALAQGPAVLLLDEPTSALDHAARDAIEATLAELRRRAGDLDRPGQPRPRAGAPARRLGGAARGGPGRRLRALEEVLA